ALLVQAHDFAIQHGQFCIRDTRSHVLGKVRERREWIVIAGNQLSTAIFDDGRCPEAVVLQFEQPVGVIEGQRPRLEGHWLELTGHSPIQQSKDFAMFWAIAGPWVSLNPTSACSGFPEGRRAAKPASLCLRGFFAWEVVTRKGVDVEGLDHRSLFDEM